MDRKKIEKQLKQCVKMIKKNINPQKIILYGSFARGDANSWSDIDIAIIAPFTNLPIKKRLNLLDKMSNRIDSKYLFDIRGYKKTEFEKISRLSIYNEIKREGITLYLKN